jgi:DNA polymerase-3 subunit delta'
VGWDFIGNEWAVAALQRQLAAGQVGHAYLFTGPPAVGKRTLGLRFAQALNCERVERPGEICDAADPQACRACRAIRAGRDPDLHLLSPEPSIGVDEIRRLQGSLALAPYAARRRVALLPDFHRATGEAANALLKTLEEPAARVVLLLTSPEQELLLPTVASRCMLIPLRGVPTAQIRRALEERGVAPERAAELAAVADGCPGRALALSADSGAVEARKAALQEFSQLLSMEVHQRVAAVDRIVGRGEPAEQRRRAQVALGEWLSLARDLVYQGYGAQLQFRNPDFAPALSAQADRLSPAEREGILRTLVEALQAVEANANPRLSVEQLLLDWPSVDAVPVGRG